MGRLYELPAPVLAALEQVLGPGVQSVKVVEHSLYARAHAGMSATTRPNLILVTMSGHEFVANASLLLHEYFHVVQQWNTGRLTRRRYLAESLLRGYHENRFEREAREFARDSLREYQSALRVI